MNDSFTNHINMVGTTVLYCVNHPDPMSGVPKFAPAIVTIGGKLVIIRALVVVANGGSHGTTEDNHDLRAVIERIGFKLENAVAAYASSISNHDLEVRNSHTKSDLKKLKKEDLLSAGNQIHADALLYQTEAGDYGYIPDDVTDLGTACGLYTEKIQSPAEKIVTINAAKASAELMLGNLITNNFEKLTDRMVNTVEDEQNEFYKGYFSARGIHDLGTHHGRIGGTTVDINDSPLDGVIFTFKKTGTDTILATLTSADGGKFNEYDVLPANYDMTWTLAGHHTVTKLNQHLSPGKSLRYHITMLPIV